jgi:[ribosomal protein S18]-alanine N-acetyltransferase
MTRADPVHATALAALHASAFAAEEAWGESAFARQLELPGVFGFIHPDAGLVLARVAADEAEILTLGVASSARRRGVGMALLRAALRDAAARGAETAFLEVSAGNAAARRLYAAAGFRPVGRRPSYYAGGADALVFAVRLSHAAAASA